MNFATAHRKGCDFRLILPFRFALSPVRALPCVSLLTLFKSIVQKTPGFLERYHAIMHDEWRNTGEDKLPESNFDGVKLFQDKSKYLNLR